jgi:ABC-type dipeptide/oligopeptide/nickel transport system permease subunit
MDVLWLSIGILIGWVAAWISGLDRRPRGRIDTAPATGYDARRRIRYHVLRAVVTLVLVGIILTVWSMKPGS